MLVNTRLATAIRRITRWFLGLAAIPLGALTLILFCTTGRPVPRGFVPNSQPNFGLNPKDGWPEIQWYPGSGSRFISGVSDYSYMNPWSQDLVKQEQRPPHL